MHGQYLYKILHLHRRQTYVIQVLSIGPKFLVLQTLEPFFLQLKILQYLSTLVLLLPSTAILQLKLVLVDDPNGVQSSISIKERKRTLLALKMGLRMFASRNCS